MLSSLLCTSACFIVIHLTPSYADNGERKKKKDYQTTLLSSISNCAKKIHFGSMNMK